MFVTSAAALNLLRLLFFESHYVQNSKHTLVLIRFEILLALWFGLVMSDSHAVCFAHYSIASLKHHSYT